MLASELFDFPRFNGKLFFLKSPPSSISNSYGIVFEFQYFNCSQSELTSVLISLPGLCF